MTLFLLTHVTSGGGLGVGCVWEFPALSKRIAASRDLICSAAKKDSFAYE